jgi:hypothetical protein
VPVGFIDQNMTVKARSPVKTFSIAIDGLAKASGEVTQEWEEGGEARGVGEVLDELKVGRQDPGRHTFDRRGQARGVEGYMSHQRQGRVAREDWDDGSMVSCAPAGLRSVFGLCGPRQLSLFRSRLLPQIGHAVSYSSSLLPTPQSS